MKVCEGAVAYLLDVANQVDKQGGKGVICAIKYKSSSKRYEESSHELLETP
jgi:hypothetical protein